MTRIFPRYSIERHDLRWTRSCRLTGTRDSIAARHTDLGRLRATMVSRSYSKDEQRAILRCVIRNRCSNY